MKKVLIYNTSNITTYICYGRPALMGSAYAVGKGGLPPTAYAYTPAVPDGEFGKTCDSSLLVHTWRKYKSWTASTDSTGTTTVPATTPRDGKMERNGCLGGEILRMVAIRVVWGRPSKRH